VIDTRGTRAPADGDIIIMYSGGRFVFNGSNQNEAPDDEFVQQFLLVYNTLFELGVGCNLQELSMNPMYQLKIERGAFNKTFPDKITWNPTLGLKTDNGFVLSPATILEHEADHALQRRKFPTQHSNDKVPDGSPMTNPEERRVITGTEQAVARAMGEIGVNQVTRDNHRGEGVVTTGPTSNVVDNHKTYLYYLQLSKDPSLNVHLREYYLERSKKHEPKN
jgi:hypothetical protein